MRARTRPPTHPGGILARHYLAPLGLHLTQAATVFGVSRTTLARLVQEQGTMTPALAARLAQALHTTPALWLTLQRSYDAYWQQHTA